MNARWPLLIALAIVGVAMRGVEAARKSLWLDEFHTLHVADSTSFVEVVEKIEPDFHPPLFFWALSFVRDVDPHLQRWLPIVLSMLTLVPLFAIVKRARLTVAAQVVLCGVFAFAPQR